jgi:hypothetical protein
MSWTHRPLPILITPEVVSPASTRAVQELRVKARSWALTSINRDLEWLTENGVLQTVLRCVVASDPKYCMSDGTWHFGPSSVSSNSTKLHLFLQIFSLSPTIDAWIVCTE